MNDSVAPKPTVVLALIRVSTRDQQERDPSKPVRTKKVDAAAAEAGPQGERAQIDAIEAYCTHRGWPAPTIYREQESGALLHERDVLLELWATGEVLAQQGNDVHIIAYKMDRFARDTTAMEILIQNARVRGFMLHSTDTVEDEQLARGVVSDDPMAKLVRTMLAAFADLERGIIKLRLLGGLKAKSKRGGYVGGRPPLGYLISGRELERHAGEAEIVRFIFHERQSGAKYRDIVAALWQRYPGIRHWHDNVVGRVLGAWRLYVLGEYTDRLGNTTSLRADRLRLFDGDEAAVLAAFMEREAPVDTPQRRREQAKSAETRPKLPGHLQLPAPAHRKAE